MRKDKDGANSQVAESRLEENADALLKDVAELEEMARGYNVLVPKPILWKLKTLSWIGVFVSGCLLGGLVGIAISESRYRVSAVSISTNRVTPELSSIPATTKHAVAGEESQIRDGSQTSSPDTLLQKVNDLLERIKQGK